MKKTIFSTLVMALILVSCNQKSKEAPTDDSHMMHHDTTITKDKSKMMENTGKYACPMHPEVQGKLNDKCSKCGMKLTEPVKEKKE